MQGVPSTLSLPARLGRTGAAPAATLGTIANPSYIVASILPLFGPAAAPAAAPMLAPAGATDMTSLAAPPVQPPSPLPFLPGPPAPPSPPPASIPAPAPAPVSPPLPPQGRPSQELHGPHHRRPLHLLLPSNMFRASHVRICPHASWTLLIDESLKTA